jgi:hypothetical protein
MPRNLILIALLAPSVAQLSLVFNGSDVLHTVDSFSYVNYNIDTGAASSLLYFYAAVTYSYSSHFFTFHCISL